MAGFLGSSSGIPASTFPTKSAPTSAALVYIPPPTRAKSACVLAPIPNVNIVVVIIHNLAVDVFSCTGINQSNNKYHKDISKRPRPTTTSPITAPLLKATFNPLFNDSRAAFAVRADAYVAVFIPKKPDNPEKKPPVKNAIGTHEFCTLNP